METTTHNLPSTRQHGQRRSKDWRQRRPPLNAPPTPPACRAGRSASPPSSPTSSSAPARHPISKRLAAARVTAPAPAPAPASASALAPPASKTSRLKTTQRATCFAQGGLVRSFSTQHVEHDLLSRPSPRGVQCRYLYYPACHRSPGIFPPSTSRNLFEITWWSRGSGYPKIKTTRQDISSDAQTSRINPGLGQNQVNLPCI